MFPIWGAHSAAHIWLQSCFVLHKTFSQDKTLYDIRFVLYKTFSRYKTLCGIHLVPPKTFSLNQIAWKLPALARRVWGGKDSPSVAYQSAWPGRQAYMGSFLSISYVRGLWFPEARPNSWNITKCEKWQGLLQNLATIRPVDTYKGVFGTPIGIRTQTVRTGIWNPIH